jgi:Tfp pilus assembly protein PilV
MGSRIPIRDQSGFSVVEILLAIVIFPMMVYSLQQAYDAVRKSYTVSKELNEIYAVLSACPEIDRALEYDSVTSATNCYPNNTFKAEGGSGRVISYSPTLSVTNTSALAATDPLRTVPDSKVVNIKVGFQHSTAPQPELRLLITRNGIGQL